MGSSPQNFLPSTCSPSWLSFHCALPNNFLWLSSPHLLHHSLTLLPTLLLGLLVPNLTGMQRKRVMQTEWFEDNTPILIPTISGSRLLIQRTPRDSTWTPLTFLLPMWTPRPWPQPKPSTQPCTARLPSHTLRVFRVPVPCRQQGHSTRLSLDTLLRSTARLLLRW